MKRLCKNIDITDRDFVSVAVQDCLRHKYGRHDVMVLLAENSNGLSTAQINVIYYRYGKRALWWCVENLIDTIVEQLVTEKISFVPIWYKDKIDKSSGKLRRIGIQDVKQQIYDYIAVYALEPLFRRFGQYQCASIPGRGQLYGVKAIQKWLCDGKRHYVAKLDVRHCFESIDRDKLLTEMRKRVENDKLMWLVEKLVWTFESGLSIGSYLSQHLCNFYMSLIYHYMSESNDLCKIRKHKHKPAEKKRLFSHILIYMDDILLIGERSADLHKAVKLLIAKANELGLTIKDSWVVFKADQIVDGERFGQFIDMMGIKIYLNCLTIRKCVWKRIRRLLLRLWRKYKSHKTITLKQAQTMCSYYGLIKNTNHTVIMNKYHVDKIMKICKERIRDEGSNVREAKPRAGV